MFQDGFFLTDVKKESRKEKTIFLKTNENFFGLLHGHEVPSLCGSLTIHAMNRENFPYATERLRYY